MALHSGHFDRISVNCPRRSQISVADFLRTEVNARILFFPGSAGQKRRYHDSVLKPGISTACACLVIFPINSIQVPGLGADAACRAMECNPRIGSQSTAAAPRFGAAVRAEKEVRTVLLSFRCGADGCWTQRDFTPPVFRSSEFTHTAGRLFDRQ
jgi:hypothetical protein